MSPQIQANAIADYWDGHPVPPAEPVTPEAQAKHDAALAGWESKFAPQGPPDPPEPPTIPGPASPGAGMPAARATDTTAHGGTIGAVTTGVAAKVLIGQKPAACAGDPHLCPMFTGLKPHVGGTISKGSATVKIGFKPAARVSDLTVCSPEPGAVAVGEPTVVIGE